MFILELVVFLCILKVSSKKRFHLVIVLKMRTHKKVRYIFSHQAIILAIITVEIITKNGDT